MRNLDIGNRVRLVHTSDAFTKLKPGDLGTIAYVDRFGTVHINWDSGSKLGLIPGEDHFNVIEDTNHG